MNLVRAEWTKLLTTKVGFWLLVAGCLMAGGFTALFTGLAGADDGLPPADSAQFGTVLAGIPAQVTVITVVLGIIGMTQEYRHRTATPTFLSSPRRGRVVLAKLVSYAMAGLVVAIAVVVVVVAVSTVYGGALGAAPEWSGAAVGGLARSGLALIVYAVIGVGVGALVRNQVGAVVGALVYLFVVEPIIASVPATSAVYAYLPGGARNALTADGPPGVDLLTSWQGGLLLLGYGLVAAVLGTVLAVRRDVV